MMYQSINGIEDAEISSGQRRLGEDGKSQLLCTERELPLNIEEEIKDGFFELKQKFKDEGPSSIYISHVVLHQKHPLFKKNDIETLKEFLIESSVVYLNKDQILYRSGYNDNFVYFVLFGRLILQSGSDTKKGGIDL